MNATVIAAAGGAIAIATLDMLVMKGILSRADASQVLSQAITQTSTARGPEMLSVSQFLSGIAQQFANG
jgi:hypothetical protein